jgi:glycine dehydrogenase subunit 1
MAQRLKGRPKALLARTLHPQYRHVVRTYIRNLGIRVEEIAYDAGGSMDVDDLRNKVDDLTSVVVTQSPNFFGVCEDLKSISEIAHRKQALSAAVVSEALSLGLLEAPGKLGADIVTGEAQSFGIPLSFGGPYLGFMACLKGFVRQLPGRIAGQTKDVEGARGYVLTLATREQHIRRESATSNICTNQALCALRATVFLETLGKEGLREMARQNAHKARYALERLTAVKGVGRKFGGGVFNEFVCEFPKDWEELDPALKERGILGGIGLGRDYPELRRCALVCVTEKHTRAEIDRYAEALEEVLR